VNEDFAQAAEEALEASDFKPIWDVLEALKSHALRAHLVAQTTESWMFWYGRLKAYKGREGHCRVPTDYREEGGYNLGAWVVHQRHHQEELSTERRRRLDELGFIWDAHGASWEEGFAYLRRYKERAGSCRVPQGYKEDGFNLGTWISVQRGHKNELSRQRRSRLDELGFLWDPYAVDWEEGFSHLQRYKNRVGDCRVPKQYEEDGFILGAWVSKQRSRKNKLSSERRHRLDELGFVWDPRDAAREEGLNRLKSYKERVGDCLVPYKHTEDGFNLGIWTNKLRSRRNQVSGEHRRRLDELGFEWEPLEADWEEGFGHLKSYKERVGDCRVPQQHKEDGYNLGTWVSIQRHREKKLSTERRRRLDELGFIWDPIEADWEEGFSHLKRYMERVGDCSFPREFKEHGYNLGLWAYRQRSRRNELSSERRRRLDEVGFVWDWHEAVWGKGFGHLKRYKERVGDCRVPRKYKNNGFDLGKWVQNQRSNRDTISEHQRSRLDELGFVWDPREIDWENGLCHLKRYKERVGDCHVPRRHIEDGYNLGLWVGAQRAHKNQLSSERRRCLADLGFVWTTQ
jgi:hypothetical protein